VSGSVLVGVVLVMILLASFLILIVGAGRGRLDAVQLAERSARALDLAETGVSEALYELGRNEDMDAETGVGNVAGEWGGGTYETVTTLHGDRFLLRSVGEYHGVRRSTEVVVALAVGNVRGAITARGKVDIKSGSMIDAYDSRLGSYDSQVHTEGGWTFAEFGGHVDSNGSVKVDSSAVHGDVGAGPAQTLDITDTAYVAGLAENRAAPLVIEDPSESEFLEAHDSGANDPDWDSLPGVTYDHASRSLNMTSGDLLLEPGVYFFSSVNLSGGARIVANAGSGMVRIYITGGLDAAGGGLANPCGDPPDMHLFIHPYPTESAPAPPSVPQVKLVGGADCRMLVDAPAADVKISGGGEFWGSIIGNNLDVHAHVHYDKALGAQCLGTGDFTRYERVSWRELSRSP
jgi:hypothetical protein